MSPRYTEQADQVEVSQHTAYNTRMRDHCAQPASVKPGSQYYDRLSFRFVSSPSYRFVSYLRSHFHAITVERTAFTKIAIYTEVQPLGELRMSGIANAWWAGVYPRSPASSSRII